MFLNGFQGAESIYLHVLRPLIKPYTATLDSLLDLTVMFGDFLFLLFGIPIRLVISWWQSSFFYNLLGLQRDNPVPILIEEPHVEGLPEDRQISPELVNSQSISPAEIQVDEIDISANLGGRPIPTELHRVSPELGKVSLSSQHHFVDPQAQSQQADLHTSPLEMGYRRPSTKSQTRLPARRLASDPQPTPCMPEVWYPPPSSYDSQARSSRSNLTRATPLSSQLDPNATGGPSSSPAYETEQVDEWRAYPPFPSAYPVTPLPALSTLPRHPSADNMALSPRRHSGPAHFPSRPESQAQGQGLRQLNRHAGGDLSDNDSMSDVQDTTLVPSDVDIGANGANEIMDEQADDFNISTRTPRPTRGGRRKKSTMVASSNSANSPPMDDESFMRNGTTSESSTSVSVSDSSSVHGQKRAPPRTAVDGKSRTGAFNRSGLKKIRPKRVLRSSNLPATWEDQTSTSNSETAEEDDSESISAEERRSPEPGLKRRRVIDLPEEPMVAANAKRTVNKPVQAPLRTSSRLANARTLPSSSSRQTLTDVTPDGVLISRGNASTLKNTRSRK
jgi:hypothetical protein